MIDAKNAILAWDKGDMDYRRPMIVHAAHLEASSQTIDDLPAAIAKVRASAAKLGLTIDEWVRRFNA